jgi:SPP1 family predicted phage head-tail adaptor
VTAAVARWPDTGELIRRVTIRRWTDTANVGYGIDHNFDAGITRWAKIQPVFGVAYIAAQQIGEDITHRIWLRYGPGTRTDEITVQHVIDYSQGNRRYRVVRATNSMDAQMFTMVECKDLGAIT